MGNSSDDDIDEKMSDIAWKGRRKKILRRYGHEDKINDDD